MMSYMKKLEKEYSRSARNKKIWRKI